MRDSVAIVTGAGSGIGAALVRQLAVRGVNMVLVGRRLERLAASAKVVRDEGSRSVVVQADLVDVGAPAHIVSQTIAAFGRIDVVVNNAAAIANKPFGQVTVDDFERTVATNTRAAFFLIQSALPALLEAPAPAVVNVSSAAASMSRATQSVYGLSKAALEHMTRSLAMELAPQVRVNAVAPGPTETEIHAIYAGGEAAARRRDLLCAAVPAGRLGMAEEVARWIVALVEPAAAWVTGTVIHIDGGRVLGAPNAV